MIKNQVEAVLFAVGKQIKIEDIARMCNSNKENVQKALKELQEDYNKRDSAVMITNTDDIWKMSIKENFLSLVRNIVTETDLDVQTMETLALIAYSSPILQSDVIDKRNASAYDHIKVLMDLGFITRNKKGRTFVIRITEKFWEYFDIEKSKAHPMFNQFRANEVNIESQEKELEDLEAERLKEQDELKKHAEQKQKPLPLGNRLDSIDGGGVPEDVETEYDEIVKKQEEEEKLRAKRREERLKKIEENRKIREQAAKEGKIDVVSEKMDSEIEEMENIEEELEEEL